MEDLTKYYEKFLAVDCINFTVKQGEIFGFLGPNGAGKTTIHTLIKHEKYTRLCVSLSPKIYLGYLSLVQEEWPQSFWGHSSYHLNK